MKITKSDKKDCEKIKTLSTLAEEIFSTRNNTKSSYSLIAEIEFPFP